MTKRIGTYEARTHWSEVIQEVKKGERYVITHHGEAVAEIIPSESETRQQRSKDAAKRLLRFMKQRTPVGIDFKSLVDEGRD